MKKSLLYLVAPLVFACGSAGAQTYLSQDFEVGNMPAGWASAPAGDWTVPGVTSTYFAPPAHTVYAAINDDAVQAALHPNSALTSPVINLASATTVFLKYDAFYLHGSNNNLFEVAELRYSTDGGTTWTVYGTVPSNTSAWTTQNVDLTAQLAGQANVKIAFGYNDNTEWNYGLAIDNVKVFAPIANDASLLAVTPSTGSPASYGVVATNINIGGTISNEGTSPITSIVVKYDAGAGIQTYTMNSINIASFGTLNFTHNIPYNIPSAGSHPIAVWVELTGDGDATNDGLSTVIQGISFIPVHAVTVEEGTGTWCGWCVRGMVYLDSMNAVHPSTCNLVAVHNGDPMVVTAYDAGVGTLIAGYPSTLVNRDLVSDPSSIFPDYNATINDFGYADLTNVVSFNATTRVATVVTSAHFAADLNGDYRLACAFTEDLVHSTAGGQWDQHNYYSSQSQNIPLVNPETGMNFQTLPQVIPSAQMYYNFVARTIVGGFNGLAGSLPAVIPAGSTQTHTFTYTVPAGYNIANMHIVVMLLDNTTASVHIMNSAGSAVPLGVETSSALNGVSVYPNPFNQSTTLELNLLSNDNVIVEMFDMTGKLISTQNEGSLSAGKHMIAINGANLAEGMYFVKITAGTSVVTEKVSIAH